MIIALDTYLVLNSVIAGYQFLKDSYQFYDSGALLLTAVSLLLSYHVCAFLFNQYKHRCISASRIIRAAYPNDLCLFVDGF